MDLSSIDLLVLTEKMAMTGRSACGWKILIALDVFKIKVILWVCLWRGTLIGLNAAMGVRGVMVGRRKGIGGS